ncbi:cytochrome P450 [Cognatiyoonia sp. IB215182]|uniref:cytochrome P450 n=1 Tax=Cognatiyoonia sp. IB215182 TaxID=3097353 RepID=UPI002A23BEA8|nr:cytochrome P450 [Cognatiyoonia sp. IB215182]
MLAAMRAEGPLVRVKMPIIGDIWMTTTDITARQLLKSPALFGRDSLHGTGKTLAQRYWYFPSFLKVLFQNMLGADGPAHARLRGLVEPAFNKASIDDMRPRLTAIADELLDKVDAAQTVDVIQAYTRPLPLKAMCDLLGIPPEDRAMVANWISPLSGPTNAWSMLRGLPGLRKTVRYFRADFARVRREPRPGMITDLVKAEAAGDRLSDDELLAMVVTLFIAGHETTVHLITMGIYGLLTLDGGRDALRDRPDEVPLLVEEFMRFWSPVMMTKPHFVREDTVFDGVSLKKGDQIAALLIAANHDQARFAEPESFIPNRRPNAHLGFGHGPHVCLGIQLARAEAQVAITRLFNRFPDLRLAAPNEKPRYLQRVGMRGLKELRLRLS